MEARKNRHLQEHSTPGYNPYCASAFHVLKREAHQARWANRLDAEQLPGLGEAESKDTQQ